MEKDCYQEIVAEVSKKLAQKITAEEKDLAPRAMLIDKDIAEYNGKCGKRMGEKERLCIG